MLNGLFSYLNLGCSTDPVTDETAPAVVAPAVAAVFVPAAVPVDQRAMLAGSLYRAFPTLVDPLQSAEWMIQDLFGADRAIAFFSAIELILQTPNVPIAGSAALYMEILADNRHPRFCPNDIDAWADNATDADALCARIFAVTANPHLRKITNGTIGSVHWKPGCLTRMSAPDNVDGPLPIKYPCGTHVVSTTVGQIDVQIIFHTAENYQTCDCDAMSACRSCMGGEGSGRYPVALWPRGRPQHCFDIDVACVSLSQGFKIERSAGSSVGPGMTLLPSAIWRIRDGCIVWVEPEMVRRRIKKYAARGFTTVCVPDHYNVDGQRVSTPPHIRDIVVSLGLDACNN